MVEIPLTQGYTAIVDDEDNTSGYKGVGWSRASGKWRAYIQVDGRQVHLGLHLDPLDAARVYDAAALEHFGEYARLNFPGGAR